jgi:hypothetical protein
MKSYTDIKQSKRLVEFLPLESADMCYRIVAYNPNDTHVYQPYCFCGTLESDIPCWSLAALLSVLNDYTLQTNTDRTVFVVCESKKPMISDAYDNPVDACCELILKLHELNLL